LVVYNSFLIKIGRTTDQQAADEVDKVRNSATRNFRHFRRCNLGRKLNKNNCISSNLLTSVGLLCLNVCRLCVPNITNLGMYFIKKNAPRQSWRVCLIPGQKIRVIFGVRFERRKVDRQSKPTRKLKHANSILESFEYFCQVSSKSTLIISSCTPF